MGQGTKIQWAHYTFNPWIGCAKARPFTMRPDKMHRGCANCYAEKDMDQRRGRVKWGENGTRSMTASQYWKSPHSWDRKAALCGERHRVFCASLGDVFEDWNGPMVDHKSRQLFTINGEDFFTEAEYPECRSATMGDVRKRLFEVIDSTPHLDWMLLTKRPENIRRMWPDSRKRNNVWLGTSVSDQATADEVVPRLQACRDLSPALFLSAEPLLDAIDLSEAVEGSQAVDLVILGGESGPDARPCAIEWIEHGVNQCQEADVAAFVKQLGANPKYWDDGVFPGNGGWAPLKLDHKKGGDMDEWPERLRIRELPLAEVVK